MLADDGFLVDVLGRRRLDEDAVDGGIGVEIADDLEQFLLRGFRRAVRFSREWNPSSAQVRALEPT